MERRSISKVLLAILVIPLVLLLAGIAWSKTYDPFKALSNHPDPSTTIFVSHNAPLSLSLTVNPDRLLAVSPSPLRWGQSKTQAELENFRDSLLGLGEIDYKTAVQPWLGDEMTLAVTSRDVDRTLKDGRQPGYLLVLKTQDAEASRSFLETFWRLRSSKQIGLNSKSGQTKEIYQGSEITYGQVRNSIPQFSDVPFTLASAIVGNQYVLFANSPKVLKNAINNVQAPDLNLRGNDQYQRALGAIDSQRLGVLYVNLPEFTALTGDDSIVRSLVQLPEQSPVTYSTAAFAIKGSLSGLILETALVPEAGYDVPLVSNPTSNTVKNASSADQSSDQKSTKKESKLNLIPSKLAPNKTSEEAASFAISHVLPANSTTIAVGKNLAQLWPSIAQTFKGYPSLEQLQKQTLQSLSTQTQLDLIQDVFQWVNGEYGWAILSSDPPSNPPSNPQITPGQAKPSLEWVFAVKRNAPEIQQGLAKLDQIARDRGLNIGPVQLATQTVQAWTKLSSTKSSAKATPTLQATTVAAHTTIGEYEVFSTSLETLSQLANQSVKTLDDNASWNQSIKAITMPNQGYFYTDWNGIQPIVEQTVPGLRFLELLAQPIVTHLKSFTVSAADQPNAEIGKGTIVVGLK